MRMLIATAFIAGVGLAIIASAQAMPIAPLDQPAAGAVIQVYGGCGWGGHRGPFGGCRPLYNCPPGWHTGLGAAFAGRIGSEVWFRDPSRGPAGTADPGGQGRPLLAAGPRPGAAPKAGEMARYERTGDAEADAGLGPAPWATPGWSCHAARRAGSLLYLSLNFIEA
jgi:hypothetical protein